MTRKPAPYQPWITVLFIFIIIGCSPSVRYTVLSTIFDGVPPPEITPDSTGDSLQILTDTLVVVVDETMVLKPSIYHHVPYANKECNECHVAASMGKFTAEQPDLCLNCHESDLWKKENTHGPFGLGECTQCHNPHFSENPGLAVAEDPDLCRSCHSELQSSSDLYHTLIDQQTCISCHDPHNSDNEMMLVAEACTSCHELKTDHKYSHGPFELGSCGSCHDSHGSQKEVKLTIAGNDLCLNCHSTLSMDSDKIHSSSSDSACTKCHNPHGSDKPYFLVETP